MRQAAGENHDMPRVIFTAHYLIVGGCAGRRRVSTRCHSTVLIPVGAPPGVVAGPRPVRRIRGRARVLAVRQGSGHRRASISVGTRRARCSVVSSAKGLAVGAALEVDG